MKTIKVILWCSIFLLFACNTVVFDEPQPAIDLRAQSSGNSFSNPIELQSIPDKFQGIFTMDRGRDTIKIFSDKIFLGTLHWSKGMINENDEIPPWYHLGQDLVVIQDGNQYFFNICAITEEYALAFFELAELEEKPLLKEDSLMLYALIDKWQCFELEHKNEDIQVYPFHYEMERASEVLLGSGSFDDFENWRYYKKNIQHINANFIYGEREDDDIFDFDVVLVEDVSYQGFWKLLKAAKTHRAEDFDVSPFMLKFHQSIDSIQE